MFMIIELLFIVLLVMILFMLYKGERMLSKKVLPRAKIEECWNGRERRRHVRFKKMLEATYVIEKKPRLKSGKTVDISEGGAKLILAEKLSKGTMLCLEISIPGSQNTVEMEGEIVWSNESNETDPSGKRLFYSGVRIVAIKEPSAADFINYIRSLM